MTGAAPVANDQSRLGQSTPFAAMPFAVSLPRLDHRQLLPAGRPQCSAPALPGWSSSGSAGGTLVSLEPNTRGGGMGPVRNLDRFKDDLRALLEQSAMLELALFVKTHGKEQVLEDIKELNEENLKKLPQFTVTYEAWYSESLAVIKQLLPDRLQDFKEHFESNKNRRNNDITHANYRIQDALNGLRVSRGSEVIVDHKAAIPHFQQQRAILKAAERRFESSLFEIRQLLQADLFDSEIAAARELAKKKFVRAAGAVAGVILEKHLAQVCDDHGIKVAKKNPGIGDLNELLKTNSVIDVPQWRFISMLGDIRNICDHNKNVEPTNHQVSDLIDGTDKILKTVL
jgi:hypothetical protein